MRSRFAADATPLGTEFQVNRFTYDNQSRGAMGAQPNGNFVVVWQSYYQDGDDYGVFGQRFLVTCGDGNIDPGEFCDPPDGVTCTSTCQTPLEFFVCPPQVE